ncbi:MAG: AzlD domain-containing protein [Coriobacteriales bacterium]|jgi:CRISPR-associated DxTHG motif protein|nr:AzlD domain-containing protein [Coriobacteriales bacterium]
MPWHDFLLIFALCFGSILFCRVAPVLVFAKREVPPTVTHALNYIPVAAFAALVANDLFNPAVLQQGAWVSLLPLVAAAPVVLVALITKSLFLCFVTGGTVYALLYLFTL